MKRLFYVLTVLSFLISAQVKAQHLNMPLLLAIERVSGIAEIETELLKEGWFYDQKSEDSGKYSLTYFHEGDVFQYFEIKYSFCEKQSNTECTIIKSVTYSCNDSKMLSLAVKTLELAEYKLMQNEHEGNSAIREYENPYSSVLVLTDRDENMVSTYTIKRILK